MLLYHPIYDIFHCVFRLLRIITASNKKSISIEQIRILDFYLLFPSQIKKMKAPKESVKLRNEVSKNLNPYDDIENQKLIFNRMEHYQLTALRSLASHNLIDLNSLNDGFVKPIISAIPEELKESTDAKNEEDSDLMYFIVEVLLEIHLYGADGLKARTNLFEYRYDPS